MLSNYIYTYISVSVRVYLDTVVLRFSFACFAFLVFFLIIGLII